MYDTKGPYPKVHETQVLGLLACTSLLQSFFAPNLAVIIFSFLFLDEGPKLYDLQPP